MLSSKASTALKETEIIAKYGHVEESLAHLDSAYRLFDPSTKDLFEKYRINSEYYLYKLNNIALESIRLGWDLQFQSR